MNPANLGNYVVEIPYKQKASMYANKMKQKFATMLKIIDKTFLNESDKKMLLQNFKNQIENQLTKTL